MRRSKTCKHSENNCVAEIEIKHENLGYSECIEKGNVR